MIQLTLGPVETYVVEIPAKLASKALGLADLIHRHGHGRD